MQKKTQRPTKQVAAIVPQSTKINVDVDMTPATITMTYGEMAVAFAAMGFIGSKLNPNNFDINTKLRVCRRALKDHVEDLDDMTQKLMLEMAVRKDGEIVRSDESGNFVIRQPDFDIERRSYFRKEAQVTTPLWRSDELEWMVDVRVEGMDEGFIFRVLEDLGPLFVDSLGEE